MLNFLLALAGVAAVCVGIYYIATGNVVIGIVLVVVGLVVAGAFGRGYLSRSRL